MTKRRKRILLVFMLIAAVVGTAVIWRAGSALTAGRASDVPPFAAPAQDFQITTSDGITLAATYWPGVRPNGPAVLFLHATDGSRGSVAGNAAWLAAQGYAVLAIDFRGHGASTITDRSWGYREATDARAAFDWLKRRQNGAPVAVVGISLGGAASLLGEAGPLPADAFILQAVYPDLRHAIDNRIAERLSWLAPVLEPLLSYQSLPRFGIWPSDMSPVTAIAEVRAPVLVIGGIEDRATPPDETRMLFDAAPARKLLYLVPTGDHATIAALADQSYRARLRSFLAETIGAP